MKCSHKKIVLREYSKNFISEVCVECSKVVSIVYIYEYKEPTYYYDGSIKFGPIEWIK